MIARGTLLSVNVGGVREFDHRGQTARSAIWKSPVSGRIVARGVNLEGDDQADRRAHGGPHKALYAYAVEDSRWWGEQLGRSLDYGAFGQNLDVEGLDVTGAVVGERWEAGSVLLEVSEPRIPCWKFAFRMNDEQFPRRFTEAGRPGAYLRIVEEGELGAGDEVRVVERPDHGLSIGDVFRIYTRDRHEVERLLEATRLSPEWKGWAEAQVEKQKAGESPGR